MSNKKITIKETGKSYSKNFNNEHEGGGHRKKYSAFDENGIRIGAAVPDYDNKFKIMKDGEVIVTIKPTPHDH
jgi:hypothetical protein